MTVRGCPYKCTFCSIWPQLNGEYHTREVESIIDELKSLNKEAKKRNYKKITMHARVSTGLSKVLQSRYGAKFLRRIENWHDFGEPFDYLEIEISEDDIEK